MSILFLSKTTDWCRKAKHFVQTQAKNVSFVEGEFGVELPSRIFSWEGDYIISFLSPWKIPEMLLKKAKRAAINFHPGPPEYPGIGCYNFALYDQALEYGVTCHHMAPNVDSGKIIKVLRFPVMPTDGVALLKKRSMAHLLRLFREIMPLIFKGEDLPVSHERWKKKPYTRKELDALCQITADMTEEEIRRRVRATFFLGFPGPYIQLGDYKFVFSQD